MTVRALARWIEGVSWGFVLLGLALPFAFASPVLGPYRDEALRWAYGAAELPARDAPLVTLMLGILGGSMAGKWIVHALVARGPLAEGRAWARDLTLRGLAAWFVVDTAASLALGAAFHVWTTGLLPIALVGVPLAMLHRRFDENSGSATEFPRAGEKSGSATEFPLRGAASPAPSTPHAASLPTLRRVCFWSAFFGASTGLAIAFGGTTALFFAWFGGLDAWHYGWAGVPDDARRFALLFFGPIGGCTFAQFVMLATWLRRDPETQRVAAAAAASVLAWFVIDSGYGLVSRGLFNIVLVNVPAVVVTLPAWVLLLRRLHRGEVDRTGPAASWSAR